MTAPRTGRRKAAVLAVLALLLPWGAAAQEARQYKLEAAFLYNFFNYITWPGLDSPDSFNAATICIEPGDKLASSLAYVQQKMAAQRTLTIREWHVGDKALGCDLLFVRAGGKLPGEQGLLTVTDGAVLRSGGMIALKQEEGRIAIRMNNSLMNERGFTASSRLLTLAQEVK